MKAQARDARPTPRQLRLLDDLETIFLAEGFRDARVADLARRLRCSRRSFYELAPTKEALFLRVLDRYLRTLRDEGSKATVGVPPELAFEPYLRPALEAARKLSSAAMRDIDAYPPASALWRRHTRERMQGLRALVERCVEQGVFRGIDPRLVAEVMTVSLRRICEPDFLCTTELSYREAVSELYGLLLHGLAHGRGEPERAAAAGKGRKR
ncbi:MAG: TetR/AcrR family transcriptional regulator [Burkholderiaceae bacterium]|nr:TetR/AcrR family transcriptional regulator [Burkholderiaceae bacterium]